ncbi:MAG TPA: hypothetical protein VFR81_23685, partial [Longimicrobium sp.]|nr:hypothetical protein [Longimicrobium sp.]
MRPSGHPRATLSLFAAALALAACEGVPTWAAPSAREAKPALTLHPCSPSLSGPSSLAVNAQGTYTLSYYTADSGCTNPTVTWSVDNGAQVVWTSSASSSLSGGQAIAGQAGIKAGSCDFNIEASSSYNGSLGTVSHKKVLVRDCTPLSVTLSAVSNPLGAIKLTWNAVRADS